MKILLIADKEHKALYDFFDRERWEDIDLILSAGDLKPAYLRFLVTMINKPLFYVRGNHDQNYTKDPPHGCVDIHGKIVEFQGLRILGLEGSSWYNGKGVQYTERQMWRKVIKLWPRLKFGNGIDIILTHNPALGLMMEKAMPTGVLSLSVISLIPFHHAISFMGTNTYPTPCATV